MEHLKKLLVIAATILCIALVLSGCRKWPENGDLDGMWQIMEIEYFDGTKSGVQKNYYNFERSICQTSGKRYCTANMKYSGNTINLDFPDFVPGQLKEYGIGENPVTLHIERLTSKILVFRSDIATVRCRKF